MFCFNDVANKIQVPHTVVIIFLTIATPLWVQSEGKLAIWSALSHYSATCLAVLIGEAVSPRCNVICPGNCFRHIQNTNVRLVVKHYWSECIYNICWTNEYVKLDAIWAATIRYFWHKCLYPRATPPFTHALPPPLNSYTAKYIIFGIDNLFIPSTHGPLGLLLGVWGRDPLFTMT